MRWNTDRGSKNVDDRSRVGAAGILVGGGIGALVFTLVTLFRGGEPGPPVAAPPQAVAAPGRSASQPGALRSEPAPADVLADFVAAILGDTEMVWRDEFATMKQAYKEPRLVLFSGQVQTACGLARASLGPFYCAADQKIFIDLGFFAEMNDRYHAPGDFARAYVIAHEVGHHVQNLLGTTAKVQTRQRGLSDDAARALEVRLELQADFLAGLWAHHADKARHILEPGDLEAGLKAVAALGDDRRAVDASGGAGAGSFTRCWGGRHGTAEQRVRWFTRGFKSGDLAQGDTIEAEAL